MDDSGEARESGGGEASESGGGELSDASSKIEELIQLCEQQVGGVVKVVRSGKPKNFGWQVEQVTTEVEYAFVKFESEALAKQADEKLRENNALEEKSLTVSFSEDKKTLFIGNVQWNALNMAVEKAGPEMAEVRLAMMETMGELSVMRYTIGPTKEPTKEYREFIETLRKKLAKRKDGSIEEIKVDKLSAKVLPKPEELKPSKQNKKKDELNPQDQLLEIELHAKNPDNDDESWTTTLAMRKDNLYIVGFTGEGGKWFQLDESGCLLPEKYNAKTLRWNVRYKSIMNLRNQDQVKRTLSNTRLGMAFAIRAVHRLSEYTDLGSKDENPTRLGLAGLIVLICEAARMEKIRKEIQSEWGRKGVLIKKEVLDYIWDWGAMSAALMRWKKYKEEFPGDSHLLEVMHDAELRLVLNSEDVEGGARVEIFAVSRSANFNVTSITVTDANTKDCTIYDHQVGQTQQGMVDLELNNVLPKGISGYKWFDLDIKFEDANAQQGAVTWRLDCRKQQGGNNATEVVTRNITFDSQHKMDVTYLVMSDTAEAKVEVKLKLRPQGGGPYGYGYGREEDDRESSECTVYGEIAARIDGFLDHRILLFNKPKAEAMKPDSKSLILKLERSYVWVPRDKRVHIEMKNLHVITAGNREVNIPETLSFDFGESSPSPSSSLGDSDVKVNIAWDGIPQNESTVEPDVQWMVDDDAQGFTKCIEELREQVAKGNNEHVLDGYPVTHHLKDRPILAKQGDYFTEAKRCVHMKLQADADQDKQQTGSSSLPTTNKKKKKKKKKKRRIEETLSTMTLAVRDDNCSGVGFMNQSEVWYDLGYWRGGILPANYYSVFLGWGVGYNQILQVSDWQEELNKNNAGQMVITKDFVMNAVRTLSRYPDIEYGVNPRIAVVALMFVFCESAKLEFLHKSFERDWRGNKFFITNDMKDLVSLAWEEMSANLVHWKYHFYRRWPDQSSELLKRMNITSEEPALKAVHLVFNRRALPDEIDLTYTIEDDANGYTEFIKKLRDRIVNPYGGGGNGVGVLPARPRDGPIWWNIELKVKKRGKVTSTTTLALRGDDLCICGFRSKDKIWYQTYRGRAPFEEEYNAFPISISMLDPKDWSRAIYGVTAARNAVVALSDFSYQLEMPEEYGTDHLWSPLWTLQLMISYSASIIPVHLSVEQCWTKLEGMTVADRNLLNLMSAWNGISVSDLERIPQGELEVFALIKDDAGDLGSAATGAASTSQVQEGDQQ